MPLKFGKCPEDKIQGVLADAKEHFTDTSAENQALLSSIADTLQCIVQEDYGPKIKGDFEWQTKLSTVELKTQYCWENADTTFA